MSSLFRISQVLKGNACQYVITKRLQDTVWLAKLVNLYPFHVLNHQTPSLTRQKRKNLS